MKTRNFFNYILKDTKKPTLILLLGIITCGSVIGQITIECGEPYKFLTSYSPKVLSQDSLPTKVNTTLTLMYGKALMQNLKLGPIYLYNEDSLMAINESVKSAYRGNLPRYEVKFSLPTNNSYIQNYCGSMFFDTLWNPISNQTETRVSSFYLPTKENELNSKLVKTEHIDRKLNEKGILLSFDQVKFYKNHLCLQFVEKHIVTKKEAKRIPLHVGESYTIYHYFSLHSGEFIGDKVNCCGIIDRY